VTPETTFDGLDAYQKVLNSGVDVVLLAAPPGFRPQHLKAAVAAGKHIFSEKPVATDAPACAQSRVRRGGEKEKALARIRLLLAV